MPVMPARASAAMSVLSTLRTAQSVVVTEASSMGGVWISPPMNSRPDTTAAMPAARVRVVGVTVMSGSFRHFAAVPRGISDGRNERGDRTSHDDVTGWGRSLHQAAFPRAQHRGAPAGDPELGEDVLGVGAQRVVRDEQLAGDLRPAELTVEQPQHLQLPPAPRPGAPGPRAAPPARTPPPPPPPPPPPAPARGGPRGGGGGGAGRARGATAGGV